jgi:hypothetical protein
MPLEDKAARRRAEHAMSKFDIDFTLANIAVINEIAYITGRVRRTHTAGGRNLDLKKELGTIADILRTVPGIRDVVVNADFD